MLVTDLITWCNSQYQPDETSDFEVTNLRWISFFNECLNECKNDIKLDDIATADIITGTDEYALPSDYVYLDELWQMSNSIYYKMTRVSKRPILADGQFYIYNKQIFIKEPTIDITEGLKMFYNKKHATLAEGSTIEIQDPYMLGYYALARVESGDRQPNEYNLNYSEYLRRRAELSDKQEVVHSDWGESW